MKNTTSAFIFAAAIIISAILISNAYRDKTNTKPVITVTGLGEKDFASDLIVWEGSFSKENVELKQAYAELEKDKKVIEDYLKSNGINAKDVVFKAVQTTRKSKKKFSNEGTVIGEEFTGYALSESIHISSTEVEKVENLSRKITELLNMGIQFYSDPPRYYYTKLSDLKIELVSLATEDARLRAEKIAEKSKARLGNLADAQMGIVQITGQHSDEEYSWGGTFNTSSKLKRASITMKLTYKIR